MTDKEKIFGSEKDGGADEKTKIGIAADCSTRPSEKLERIYHHCKKCPELDRGCIIEWEKCPKSKKKWCD